MKTNDFFVFKPGFFLTLIFSIFSLAGLAQNNGSISGVIYDQGSGDELPGVVIRLDGTQFSAASDVNGKFAMKGLPEGSYNLVATMMGFSPRTVENIQVKAGEAVTVNVELVVEGIQAEMVVTAELVNSTESSMLKHRQKSNAISDAISVEQISNSGGSNAADAVTKITGASVVGGKYVFIRGLGDRYTSTHLNGVELPTSDPDANSFQADLFPSTILDNIVTLKSFTPDKPGNFSGGIVDIGTRNYPDSLTLGISYSTSFNTSTTFNDDYLFYKGSGTDWLGSDNGLRDMPSVLNDPNVAIPDIIQARTNQEQAQLLDDISKSFVPVMSSSRKDAPMDQGFSVSLGNQLDLFGKPLGFIASLSYSRGYDYFDNWKTARWKLTEGAQVAETLVNQSDFIGEKGEDKVTWGGLGTLSYTPHPNHELIFNFIRTQSGESSSQYYLGQWPEQFSSNNAFLESRVLKYTERTLSSLQLQGNHYLPEFLGMELDWTASIADTRQYEPDTRIFTDNFSNRTINGEPTRVYSITRSIYNNPARYFRDLEEESNSFNLNASIPFHQWADLRGKVKLGGAFNDKERGFRERRFEYVRESNIRYDGDPKTFFSRDNLGIIGFNETTNRYLFGNVIQDAPDSRGGDYDGQEEITAFYGLLELPLTEKLRTISGARMEQTDLLVFNEDRVGILDEDDLLPSMSLIYEMSASANLRASFGRTLARPTFREKAPYASFDFIADGIFVGNPDLKRTLINNYDMRWEWFPGSGEIIAASVFYKEFENPIERAYNIRQASEFGERTFLNVDEARVYGLELELRKSLAGLLPDMHNLSLAANLSLIESEVDIPAEELAFIRQRDPDADETRTLQGQSPYLVNIGLNYDHFTHGTSASLFYNEFGERLDEVGYGGAPNALEQPREMLDFTFSQRLWERFTLKFVAKNLLDSPIKIIQEFKGNEFLRSEYKTGTSFSLSLSFKP